MEQENLATELLHMLKKSAQRWFIIALVELAIIISMIIGFLWYMTLPVEDCCYEQNMEEIEDSDATQMIGGELYGKDVAEGNLQEESCESEE